MRGFKRALEQDMELEKKVIRQIDRRLKILPEGWLKQGKNGASVYENRTRSLPVESQRAVEIAMRNLLEKKKQIIENNLRAQERLLKTYQSYRDDRVLEGMRQVYRNILNRFWANREKERLAKRVAEAEEQRKNGTAYHPEHLTQRNLKGEVQRSKSESILSMIYDSLQIPYNYEERVYWPQDAPERAWEMKRALGIPNFYTVDFSFDMPDGTKKYQEHLGMMDSLSYMEIWMKKMILYYWAGITPGQNLIITADNCKGGIDQQQIMLTIEAELGELIGTSRLK